MLLIRQLLVLTKEELIDVFRRRRAVITLVLYSAIAILVSRGAVWFQNRIQQVTGGQSILTAHRNEVVAALQQQNLEEFAPVLDLLAAVPSSVWIFQLFALLMIPTLAVWLSSDMIALDAHRKTLRYLLLRARRSSYVLSKVLAHTILVTVVHAVVVLLTIGWGWKYLPEEVRAVFAGWLGEYFLVTVPFILMTVAGTGFISALCSRSVTAILLVNALWLLATILTFVLPLASPYNGKILFGLMLPKGEYLQYAALGNFLWALLFTLLAVLLFRRREV